MLFHKLCRTIQKTHLSSILSWCNFNKTANISSSSCLRKRLTNEPNLGPEPKMDFKDKNAIIIGGTSGIGFQAAHSLLSAGIKHVIVTGHIKEKCIATSKILNKCHGDNRASGICFDVRNAREFEEALMYAVDKVCNLDILVNCFGIMNGQQWEDEICLNVTSLIRGTLLAYDFMGTDSVGSGGVIINVAGTMGLEPWSGAPSLAASKHAVVGFSRSYGSADTEAATGVRLVTLCPGVTETTFWDQLEDKAMVKCECELGRNFVMARKQGAEECGQSIPYVAKYADTGSVWVIEGAKLFELDFPSREDYSTLMKTYY